MDNNELRLKAFAAYMPCLAMHRADGPYAIQGVFLSEDMALFEWDDDSDWWNIVDATLLLTPLSDITDEDAIEVAKMARCYYELKSSIINAGRELVAEYMHKQSNITGITWIHITDYLRSKSYNLPFMGYDLVKEGIAKLKSNL